MTALAAATPAAGIELGAAGTVAMLVILGWLVVGEPLWGRASHQRFVAALDAAEPGARLRFYRRWSAMLWALALVVLAFAATAPGVGLARVGLRPPDLEAAARLGIPPTALIGVALGLLAGLLAGLVAGIVGTRRRAGAAARPLPGGTAVQAMLPRTPAERQGFAILALTAGITEEIVWRGFLIAALTALAPALPLAATVALSAAVFGLAHLYQGPVGVLATAIVGAVLAAIYLATSSLLAPIVLHAIIDLRVLLIRPDGA